MTHDKLLPLRNAKRTGNYFIRSWDIAYVYIADAGLRHPSKVFLHEKTEIEVTRDAALVAKEAIENREPFLIRRRRPRTTKRKKAAKKK